MRGLGVESKDLSRAEAAERLQRYGCNELVVERGRSPLTMLIARFKGALVLQLIVIYGPGMDRAFGTVPLGWQGWVLLMVLACTVYLFNEIYRIMVFKRCVANDG